MNPEDLNRAAAALAAKQDHGGALADGAAATEATKATEGASVASVARSQWPAPMGEAAYHGLVGAWIDMVAEHTEASLEALVVQFLVAFGAAAGRGAGFQVEGDFHGCNEYAAIVGQSAKARKGTSWGQVRRLLRLAAPDFIDVNVANGLSSGEGLIFHVRDAVVDHDDESGDPVVVDEGGEESLLVVESELAQALKSMTRQGNTLSPVIRSLWDDGAARTLTKNNPVKASGAHVAIVGHVTREELRALLTETDSLNGFANRFLWVASKRSKLLPEGGSLRDEDLAPVVGHLARLLREARERTRSEPLQRDQEARELWIEQYPKLTADVAGLLGAATSRAEAHVMRLATIYALLDGARLIGRRHLEAALAVWKFCEDSARWIFGDALGDRTADRILAALRESGRRGLTRTEIRDLLQRHASAAEVEQALALVAGHGLAAQTFEQTAGRPVERWTAR